MPFCQAYFYNKKFKSFCFYKWNNFFSCCQFPDGAPIGTACKRRSTARCSPSEGPCCDFKKCDYVNKASQKVCRKESECEMKQICTGISSECPSSSPKRNGTPCLDSTKVCLLIQ